jgi:phosphoribosylformimino-5-aminoimidazole carboxamide ribotide isomerase
VGGTLDTEALKTNFTSDKPAEYYAKLYREHGLVGAHVVMLGPGCEEAALAAVQAWPGESHFHSGLISRGITSRWRHKTRECP